MITMRLALVSSLAVCAAFRPGFAPRRPHVRRSPGVTRMSTTVGVEIAMPALSSTMTEGKITEWLKSVGDKVEVGDAVMVVESDKADMDVESFGEGFLAAVLVGEGEMATVGAPVALLAPTKDEIAAVAAAGGGGGAPAAAAGAAAATGLASSTTAPLS